MPKCKDCIHHEACRKMLETSGFGYAYNPEASAKRCDTFLNAADVVPRSEVAREIFAEIERVAMSKIDENAPISPLDDILYMQAIDEVREKYTEGEK